MTGALESVYGDYIHTAALGREGVPDGRALVHDLYVCSLEPRDVLARAVAGCLDDAHATLDNDIDVVRVRRRGQCWKDCEINREGTVRHGATPLNFPAQHLRRRLSQSGQHTERTGIRHGRGELRAAHPLHSSLNDGDLDAQ